VTGAAAFARWAAAGVRRFATGRPVGMYTSQMGGDGTFWKPRRRDAVLQTGAGGWQGAPSVGTGRVLHRPATSASISRSSRCFKAGFGVLVAVSVHPMAERRRRRPEYARLRQMIDRTRPRENTFHPLRRMGYSSVWKDFDATKQGKFLPRQWLTNWPTRCAVDLVRLADDGPDPRSRSITLARLPSVFASNARIPTEAGLFAPTRFTDVLTGYRFQKRCGGGPDDYVMQFAKGDQFRLVLDHRRFAARVAIQPRPAIRSIVTRVRFVALVADTKGSLCGLPIPRRTWCRSSWPVAAVGAQ